MTMIIMMNMLIMMTMIIRMTHTLNLGYEPGDEYGDHIHHSLHRCYDPGEDHDNHIHHTLFGFDIDDHVGNDYHGHHDHTLDTKMKTMIII